MSMPVLPIRSRHACRQFSGRSIGYGTRATRPSPIVITIVFFPTRQADVEASEQGVNGILSPATTNMDRLIHALNRVNDQAYCHAELEGRASVDWTDVIRAAAAIDWSAATDAEVEEAVNQMAQHGDSAVLGLVGRLPANPSMACCVAASYGNVAALGWLVGRGADPTKKTARGLSGEATIDRAFPESMTVQQVVEQQPTIAVSRIPVYGRDIDDVTGFVL